jgi:ribosomal protein L17
MSEKTKKVPASKPVAAAKPPKKLVPRTAPKVDPAPVVVAAAAIAAPQAAAPAAVAATKTAPVKPAAASPTAAVKAKPVRKPTEVEVTVAKHQKVLADALVKAQAIKYDQPKVMKQPAAKPEKAPKPRKVKLVRDSYAMPEGEYVRIAELKKRLLDLGAPAKKSELLRGGIAVLAALNDAELKAVMGRVERIKTGRPNKK